CEVDEGHEHDIELLETGEDAAEALQAAEQRLDFGAAFVHGAVVLRWRDPIRVGLNHRSEPKVEGQLPGLVTLVRSVHQKMHWPRASPQTTKQLATLGRVMGLAGRQCKRYGRSSIRGNHMNLGGPSGAG